jgi:hypothetical protein
MTCLQYQPADRDTEQDAGGQSEASHRERSHASTKLYSRPPRRTRQASCAKERCEWKPRSQPPGRRNQRTRSRKWPYRTHEPRRQKNREIHISLPARKYAPTGYPRNDKGAEGQFRRCRPGTSRLQRPNDCTKQCRDTR